MAALRQSALRLGVAAAIGALAALAAAPPAGAGDAGWASMTTPSLGTGHNDLVDVSGTSGSDVWAVGYHWTDGGESVPLIQHWNGTSWTLSPIPAGLNLSRLHSVDARSANDVWAVGSYGIRGGGVQPLILHWDGTSWARQTAPNFGERGTTLHDVAVGPDGAVWAVGNAGELTWDGGFDSRGMVLRLTNGSWQIAPQPNQNFLGSTLFDVTVTPSGDVWASGGGPEGSYLHYDGAGWQGFVGAQPKEAVYGPSHDGLAFLDGRLWSVGSMATTISDPTFLTYVERSPLR